MTRMIGKESECLFVHDSTKQVQKVGSKVRPKLNLLSVYILFASYIPV